MPPGIADSVIYCAPDDGPFGPGWHQVAGNGTIAEATTNTMFGYRVMQITPAPGPILAPDTVKVDSMPMPFLEADTAGLVAAIRRDGTQAAAALKFFWWDGAAWSATVVTLPSLSTSWQIISAQAVAPAGTTEICVQISATLASGETGAIYWAVQQGEQASTAVNLAADSVTASAIAAGAVQVPHLNLQTSGANPIIIRDQSDGSDQALLYAAGADNLVVEGANSGRASIQLRTYAGATSLALQDTNGLVVTVPSNKNVQFTTPGTGGAIFTGPLTVQSIKETRGASPPGSPSTGDRHYFSTPGLWGKWDGARWLSEWEFAVGDWQYYVGAQVGVELTATQEYRNTELRDDYAHWLTRWRVRWYVSTTNNGTNNYTIALRSFPTTGTTLASVSTGAGAANTFTPVTVTNFTQPALGEGIQQYVTKVLAPGGLRFASKLFARLVLA